MQKILIRGQRRLSGEVSVAGAKNAALPIMAACLLTDEPVVLEGLPNVSDIQTLAHVLDNLGLSSVRLPTDSMHFEMKDRGRHEPDAELVRRMRASFCVLGPLVAKNGQARVALPGGCRIGERPVDIHLRGLAALGAEIAIEQDCVVARARRLRGTAIDLTGPRGSTVTGTCNVLSAAVIADGDTWIEGAAREPEVADLGNFLIALGARISGLGTSRIHVRGVRRLGTARYRVIPDRIEAATLMTAAAITNGEIRLTHVRRDHLTAVISKLRQIGLTIDGDCGGLSVHGGRLLRHADIDATPYPGVPTDVQAQLTALLAVVPGTSRVRDLVFPERFQHLAELRRMGAQMRVQGDGTIVTGVAQLVGAEVTASDLRASAALILAGLAARGETVVRQVHHLDRGYEGLDTKLRSLGADIQRVLEEHPQERRAA
jgi:UDP-N-acetylglucosamine 1-carboxyvinyltransferase